MVGRQELTVRYWNFALIPLVVMCGLASVGANFDDPASLAPPKHVGPPRPEHASDHRAFQGIPSMAVALCGRLWATWYAGVTPAEDKNNYVVLSTSGDGGRTWNEILTIDPDADGPVRAFDPELWMSPDGRLFCFWAQMDKGQRDTRLGAARRLVHRDRGAGCGAAEVEPAAPDR
jgi:hypothetical protein